MIDTEALPAAYSRCERLARAHYENFPVASRLLPAPMRPHITAIYAFARRADDFADEPGLRDEERLRLLDQWNERLHAAVAAQAPRTAPATQDDDLIILALANTIRVHRLPIPLFEDLLSAFRQDVTKSRYRTWSELMDYCRRSANPVGRLVLRVAGYDDPQLDRTSDAVCTALQLTNFWQDLARDWQAGRLYVPQEDLAHAGAREEDLDLSGTTPQWRSAMALLIRRTSALFEAGRGVCDAVRGRLRWELRLTWLGGRRVLDKVAHVRTHSLHHRPTLAAGDAPALIRDALLWRAADGKLDDTSG